MDGRAFGKAGAKGVWGVLVVPGVRKKKTHRSVSHTSKKKKAQMGGGKRKRRGRGGGGGPPASVRTAPDGRPEVDRERVCPLLLRVFPKAGSHHVASAFARHDRLPGGEVQIYTWPDATLREV